MSGGHCRERTHLVDVDHHHLGTVEDALAVRRSEHARHERFEFRRPIGDSTHRSCSYNDSALVTARESMNERQDVQVSHRYSRINFAIFLFPSAARYGSMISSALLGKLGNLSILDGLLTPHLHILLKLKCPSLAGNESSVDTLLLSASESQKRALHTCTQGIDCKLQKPSPSVRAAR
jgi:hypothetical protein